MWASFELRFSTFLRPNRMRCDNRWIIDPEGSLVAAFHKYSLYEAQVRVLSFLPSLSHYAFSPSLRTFTRAPSSQASRYGIHSFIHPCNLSPSVHSFFHGCHVSSRNAPIPPLEFRFWIFVCLFAKRIFRKKFLLFWRFWRFGHLFELGVLFSLFFFNWKLKLWKWRRNFVYYREYRV